MYKTKIKYKFLFLIIFVTMLFIYGKYVQVYANSNSVKQKPKVIFTGLFHSPILEGERIEFYAIVEKFENPLFRVFMINNNEEIELTSEYVKGNFKDGYYKVTLDEKFIKGNYLFKIWVKDEKSFSEFDCEAYIKNITVIENKDFDLNLIEELSAENSSKADDEKIEDFIGNKSLQENEIEERNDNQQIETEEKVDSTIDDINTSDYELKEKVEEEWKSTANKVVQEALLNKDLMIVKDRKLQNVVGDKFIVKNKARNIINENDDENRENEIKKYKYKLHVYDVLNNCWEYHDGDYKDINEWVPKNSGIYLLDLWTVSEEALENGVRYESWRIIPVIIEKKPKVEIESLVSTHSPILDGDKLSFYVKSRNAEMVQYRAWIISSESNEFIDATNGYGFFVKADDYYEVEINKKLNTGEYFLWVWVRTVNSNEAYDNYFSYRFSCKDKENIDMKSIHDEIDMDDGPYIEGEKIKINGMKNFNADNTEYLYKLHVYDIEKNEWTTPQEKYTDVIEWTPEKSGKYLLDLWIISKDKNPKDDEKIYDGIKLKLINIIEECEMENNDSEKENCSDNNKEEIKYTIATDFEELYSAVEKDYKLIIKNQDVKNTYRKAVHGVNEVISNDMDELQKIIAIHDYIVKNTKYDYENFTKGIIDENSYNAYGVLINNRALCEGYANTFKLMLDLLGIENYIIYGTAYYNDGNQDHAWNLVKYNNEFYHIDTTWDDPIPDDEGRTKYNYFMMTDEKISETHKWDQSKYFKSGKNDFSYFRNMHHPVIDGKWIYYSNKEDSYNLYKIKNDGKSNVKLLNASAVNLFVDNEWIYFSNYSYGGYLFKIRKDGLGITRLNNELSNNISIKDDWIIYENVYEKQYYKIRKDGSGKSKFNV